MNILKELGTKHKTDKATGHNYMDDIYHPLFRDKKDKNINILEIGGGSFGGSVKTWKDFFINGKVFLIDPFFIKGESDDGHPYSVSREDVENYGVVAIEANQLSREQLQKSKELCPEGFDYIIDDGAHMNDAIQISLATLFPLLKSGGCYIVEDLHTARRRTPTSVNSWIDNSGHVFCDPKFYHKDEVHLLDVLNSYEENKTWPSLLLSVEEKDYLIKNIKDVYIHPSQKICIINKR